MKKLYKYLDIIFMLIMTGGITGFLLNIKKSSFISIVNLVLLFLYVVMIFRVINNKQIKFGYYSTFITLTFVGYLLVNSLTSYNMSNSIVIVVNILFTLIYSYVLYSSYSVDEVVYIIRKAFDIIIIGCFITSILFPNFCTYYDSLYQDIVWRGLFTHKNTLGNMTAFYILIIIIGSKKDKRLLVILKLFIASIIIWLSKSHTPIYILLICIGYLFLKKVMKRDFSWFTFLCITFFNYLIIFKSEYIQIILNKVGIDPTLSGRIQIYQVVRGFIQSKKYLGYGIGATWNNNDLFSNIVNTYIGFNPNSAHNAYLDLTLSIGIIGLLIFIFIIGSIFFMSSKRFSLGERDSNIVVLVLFLLLMSLFESTLTNLNHIYGLTVFYTFFKLTESTNKQMYLKMGW